MRPIQLNSKNVLSGAERVLDGMVPDRVRVDIQSTRQNSALFQCALESMHSHLVRNFLSFNPESAIAPKRVNQLIDNRL